MLTIIPENELLEVERNYVTRIPYSYLHGDIQEDHDTEVFYISDIYGVFEKGENLAEGVFPAICNLNYCMLYLWDTLEGFHALAVYTIDEKANKYALKCYNSKTTIL